MNYTDMHSIVKYDKLNFQLGIIEGESCLTLKRPERGLRALIVGKRCVRLPPASPGLNSVEQIWQCLRNCSTEKPDQPFLIEFQFIIVQNLLKNAMNSGIFQTPQESYLQELSLLNYK